jgi:hypothetical protein
MNYRKIIGVVLIGVGVFILNISFQTHLPDADEILMDETGKMLESVKQYCSAYDPKNKDTFGPCAKVFDSIKNTLSMLGSAVLVGGIISYYQWLLSLLRWVKDLFS